MSYFVQSLQRGLEVIRAFDADARELTLSDVARRTGLSRAAARRFLLTLVDLGYVRTDARYFSLSPRVLELGYAYLSSLSLPEVAEPHLEALVAEVRESSSLSVLDGPDIVYVARVPVSRIMTVAINVGTRFPAHATSMGRVLLAGLAEPELDAYLEQAELQRLSPRTVTSTSAPAHRAAPRPRPGLGDGGPGARGGPARGGRAGARREREGGGRDQPLGARKPLLDRVDAPRPAAAAAGDGGADRGRRPRRLIRREALGMSRPVARMAGG